MPLIEDLGLLYVTTVLVTTLIMFSLIFCLCNKGVEDLEDPEEIYVIDNDDISSDIVVVDGYMVDTETHTQLSSPSSIDLNGLNKTYPLDIIV